jgi:hypothetical protein
MVKKCNSDQKFDMFNYKSTIAVRSFGSCTLITVSGTFVLCKHGNQINLQFTRCRSTTGTARTRHANPLHLMRIGRVKVILLASTANVTKRGC